MESDSEECDDLLGIPVEVRERILHYCPKPDLMSLALCSRAHRDLARSFIWEKVDFRWIDLKGPLPAQLLTYLNDWTKCVQFIGSENMKEVMESGLHDDFHSESSSNDDIEDAPGPSGDNDGAGSETEEDDQSDVENDTAINNILHICDGSTSFFKFLHGVKTASANRKIMQSNYVKIISSCSPAKLTSLHVDFIFDDLNLDHVAWCLPNLIQVSLCRAGQLASLAKFRQLKILSLKECIVEQPDLSEIIKSTKLENISLDKCDIDVQALRTIMDCQRLTSVSISHNSTISSSVFIDFGNLVNLTKLELTYTNLRDEALSHICTHCTKITKLNISGSNYLTDLGIQCIGNLNNLLDLNIDRCTNITESTFRILKKFQLVKLSFGWTTNISDSVFKHLVSIPSLQEISLTNINHRFSVTAIDNYCDAAMMKKHVWHSWIFSFFTLQKKI